MEWEKKKICPLTNAICDSKCAWLYSLDTKHKVCAIIIIAEALRQKGKI